MSGSEQEQSIIASVVPKYGIHKRQAPTKSRKYFDSADWAMNGSIEGTPTVLVNVTSKSIPAS